MSKPKIYNFPTVGMWIVAENMHDAKLCAGAENWMDIEDEDLGECEEVEEENLDSLTFYDDYPENCGDEGSYRSFRDQLDKVIASKEKLPTIFAVCEL